MQSILTLTRNYELHRWITTDDAITLEAKNLVLDHLGADLILYRGGTNRSGVESSLITSTIIVVDGEPSKKSGRHVPVLTNSLLFLRDRNVCAYCAGKFLTSQLTRDHIHPVSKGGADKWMNVVTACKSCNNLKGDIMPGQALPDGQYGPQGDRVMNSLYLPYIPCKAEALLMKNRSIKADQMQFLLDRIQNKDKSRIYKQLTEGAPAP